MKTLTVKSYAIKLMTATSQMLITSKPIRLDRRYNFNNDVLSYIKTNPLSEEQKQTILQKKRQRALNKRDVTPINIFSSPLVKDYRNNKGSVEYIFKDRLRFYGRNHWAKTAIDFKVLQILIKHRLN